MKLLPIIAFMLLSLNSISSSSTAFNEIEKNQLFGRFTVYLASDPLGYFEGCAVRMFVNVLVEYDDNTLELTNIEVINGGFYLDCPVLSTLSAGFSISHDEYGITDMIQTSTSGEPDIDELFESNKDQIISNLNALILAEL